MADDAATRARRSRRHRAGDHSMCRPDAFCRARGTRDSSSDSGATPDGLGAHGRELWREMRAGMASPLHVLLLLEACRMADRLDTLDRQLQGGDWLRFRHHESGVEVTVYVDRVLVEAREQATALRGIVAELSKGAAQKPVESSGGGVLADLTAKIAARRAAAQS